MLRTILFIVLGTAMWIPNLLDGNGVVSEVVTLVLVGINALIMMNLFCKIRVTNLPSAFVGATYWLVISSITILHGCWQGQAVVLAIMVAYCILQTVNYQEVPVEQAFLSSLIIAGTCAILPEVIILVGVIWGLLTLRGVMTLRVWMASLIGVATVALYFAIAYFLGAIEMPFADIFDLSHWQMWIAIGMMILTIFFNLLPLRFPSVACGVTYIVLVCCALGFGIWSNIEKLLL